VETPFTLESEAVGRLISATSGGFDVLVVDAPPTHIPQASDLVVVVCAAEVRSSAAAAEICAELKAQGSNFVAALRHRGWSGLSARDIARITQGDVSVEIYHIKNLTKTTEVAGLPIVLPKKLAAPALELLAVARSEEHTSELQSRLELVCRLLLEEKSTLDQQRNQRADIL